MVTIINDSSYILSFFASPLRYVLVNAGFGHACIIQEQKYDSNLHGGKKNKTFSQINVTIATFLITLRWRLYSTRAFFIVTYCQDGTHARGHHEFRLAEAIENIPVFRDAEIEDGKQLVGGLLAETFGARSPKWSALADNRLERALEKDEHVAVVAQVNKAVIATVLCVFT